MASPTTCPICKALRTDQNHECELEAAAVMKLRNARSNQAPELEQAILESRKRQAKIVSELQDHKAKTHAA